MNASRAAPHPATMIAMVAEIDARRAEIKLLTSLLRRSECVLIDVAQEARVYGERDTMVELLLQDIDLVLYPPVKTQAREPSSGKELQLLVSAAFSTDCKSV